MEFSAGPVTPSGAAPASDATLQRDRNVALASTFLLLIGMPVGWLPGSTGDAVGMAGAIIIVLAIMAGLFLWLLPRERAAGRASRTALILGVLAIAVGFVFWTGLPFAVGAAALALGLGARESGTGDGRATAGAILGGIAVVASFVLLLIG
ncbi:MAG TPA: hypothetical protein VF752_16240 [Thermoleophilaceae bacterium]